MPTFSTSVECQTLLNSTIQSALDRTVDRLLDKLKEYIEEDVYKSYTPFFYDTTGQFKDSWKKTKATIKGNIIESEIFENLSTLVFDSDKFQHGSNIFVENWGGSETNELAHIINDGAIGDAFGFPQLGARPFWDDFIEFCGAHFEEYFKEELHGLI